MRLHTELSHNVWALPLRTGDAKRAMHTRHGTDGWVLGVVRLKSHWLVVQVEVVAAAHLGCEL